jgi:cyanobactin maturation PatA/PatG family protease
MLSQTDVVSTPGLDDLWAETHGDSHICIAVLDGPVDQSHPSLAEANLTRITTLASGTADLDRASEHGTHVTSIIFGQHDSPVKGIAPLCRGLIVPIFENEVNGSLVACSQLDLARAIAQAVQEGAHIINISGGELSPSGSAHPILADAVQSCADNNVLIVAAAGNEGCECLHVPGSLPSVLAVGAMNTQDSPLAFSNWGDKYRIQGVLAPGENIPGAVPGGGTTIRSGTSFASPIVSGIAALLVSLQRRMGQEPNPMAVRAAILESAYRCDLQAFIDCRPYMMGSLNVSGAHALIKKGYRGETITQYGENIQCNATISKSPHDKSDVPTTLNVGDMAPAFSVKDHMGQDVSLSDYRGRTVILWFYPHADTPG